MKLPGLSRIGMRIVLMSALVLSVWVTVLALGHWLLAVSRRPAMHIEYLDRPEYDLDVLRIGYLHVINDRDHQARVPLPEFTADWRNNPGSTPLAVRLYSPVANGRITPLPSSLSLAAREEVRLVLGVELDSSRLPARDEAEVLRVYLRLSEDQSPPVELLRSIRVRGGGVPEFTVLQE